MMFRLVPVLLAALLLVPVPVVGQAGTVDTLTYLTALTLPTGTGLEVDNYRRLPFVVEQIPDAIQSTGLTLERIVTRVELRVRSVGLTPIIEPVLIINVQHADDCPQLRGGPVPVLTRIFHGAS